MRKWIGLPGCALFVLLVFPYLSGATSDVTLAWTAPGDNGTAGRASQYDLRYSTSPITSTNWDQATTVTNLPAPQSAGSQEVYKVTGLLPATTYYFCLKAADAGPNWSVLSNVAFRTTCPNGCDGQNGNVNGSADGRVDISDLSVLTSYLSAANSLYSICPDMANIDLSSNGIIDLSDLANLIAFLEQGIQFPQCPL